MLVFVKLLVVNNLIDVSESYVLRIIRSGCYDSLQSVRSVAISVLSRLVQHFQPEDVTNLSVTMVETDKCAIIHEWFEIILPMTADGEKTVQDKAMSEINVQECFLSLPNSRKILFLCAPRWYNSESLPLWCPTDTVRPNHSQNGLLEMFQLTLK